MKKVIVPLFFLLSLSSIYAQNKASLFETVLKTGNSAKAFEFVRNYFNLSSSQDPFLHFKERGIKQLISFCDYRTRRIEATSLIKFSQVREFWKNYSEQFTAGKWSYKNLFPNDSLAWLAANYSITLIYVHEMGHYMSLRFTQNSTETYTCEEYLANECLAAFANSFNGNKKMDLYKDLFLELARQTARFTPDSNKTNFEIPVKKWCDADPMNSYMHLYGSNDKEFLRFYGYTQFRMMEHVLVNYSGENFADFLNRKFYRHFNQFTGKTSFRLLKYSVLASETIKAKQIFAPLLYVNSSGANSNSFFSYYNINNLVIMVNRDGEVFKSYPETEMVHNPDSNSERSLKNIFITTHKRVADSARYIEGWMYTDTVDEIKPDVISGWENKGSFHYLIKRFIWEDSITKSKYDYYTLFNSGNKRFSRRFFLPDSITQNDDLHNEYLLAGTNMGFPLLIHNQLTKDLRQNISMYMIDTMENTLGVKLWNSSSKEKGFFNMYAPAVYIDTMAKKINIAFTNPVSERIYLIRIGDTSTEGYELFNPRASIKYPQQMRFSGLNFVSANQLYVLAGLPDLTDRPLVKANKLLIKW